ncbi:MAG TPA: glycosyl hydrolase [Sinomonas sp.]|nr:glycosyl hydrolase [Sinomonas sp.]
MKRRLAGLGASALALGLAVGFGSAAPSQAAPGGTPGASAGQGVTHISPSVAAGSNLAKGRPASPAKPAGTVSGPQVMSASAALAPAISTAHLRFGVGTPGGPQASSELDQVANLVGENPSIVLSYKDFSQAAPIDDLNAVAARGATSLVTWEPWLWSGNGVNQPTYSLKNIAAGNFDSYIRSWGTALASWGKPVMLRFAQEMNGNWYPWDEGVNGNQPGDFVAAWQHVHDVVASTGATNVQWVWSPNVPYWGSTALSELYPGAAYIDTVALDGYNWGTSQSWSSWTSPSDLFGDGLNQLRGIAPGKPIVVGETASAEAGGSKADWNTSLVSYLNAQADVIGFVWFDYNKEVDWRIDSSSSSAMAMANALAARRS